VTTPAPAILFKARQARRITLTGRSGETALAKPNYSYDKRQREIAKKKQQDEKDARKREAREAAKPASEAASKTPSGDR